MLVHELQNGACQIECMSGRVMGRERTVSDLHEIGDGVERCLLVCDRPGVHLSIYLNPEQGKRAFTRPCCTVCRLRL